MPNVTWYDPAGNMVVEYFDSYDAAASYEAGLDCSGIAEHITVAYPEWDAAMDEAAADACNAMEAMFFHDETTHQAHVRCAESHYWKLDHASHVDQFHNQDIPF